MAAEPDHLLWKCLCCEDWAEVFRPPILTLCVSLSHEYTQIFMVNMVKDEKKPSAHFPLGAPLSTPPRPPFLSPILTPHHSPYTLPSEQNSWTGEGFPAGPDLSCKEMTYLLKILGKRETRRFQERNINKGLLIWWSPAAHKEKWKRAKEKLLTNPLNDSLESWSMKHKLVFRAWIQKNWLCLCKIISLQK